MARYSIDGQVLTDIGDAIRAQTGPTTFGESYAPGKVYGMDNTGNLLINATRPNPHWDSFDPMWGPDHWFTQVFTVPDGVYLTEITLTVYTDYDEEVFFVAEGEHTEMPSREECLCYVEHTSLGEQRHKNISFTTKAKTITFGCYVLDTLASMMYYAKLSYVPMLTPEEMATTISSLQTLSPELLHWTGDVTYKNYMGRWDDFIEYYGDKITTSDITAVGNFMRSSKLKRIPFEINCKATIPVSLDDCLNSCEQLTEAPIINNLQIFNYSSMFEKCKSLREFPEGYGEDWDWSYLASNTSSSYGQCDGIFANCYSLRKLPMGLFKYCSPKTQARYSALRNLEGLYALDEITEFPLPHSDTVTGTGTSGAFYYTCRNCYRLKNFTFASDIGPKNWTNQTLDMTICVGWANYVNDCCSYNSGITMDKRVSDDASYQALKNDPDWFTGDAAYSRYNHDSAVATINSLPDCSEYQTTNNKAANIIKFKGAAGAKTDGGAINTLTDEEIAVATAKGWTVTLA